MHKLGSIARETSFASISKIDSGVGAPEITAVITTCRDPLNCTLIFHHVEEAGVDALAATHIAFLAVYRIMVDQVHMLLQCVVHKSQTVCFSWVRIFDLVTLVLEPSDLIGTDAIHASIFRDAA